MTGFELTEISGSELTGPDPAPPRLVLAPIPARKTSLTRMLAVLSLVVGAAVLVVLVLSSG